MNKKIVVGLSGGVDSSVTALLLKQQGFEVIAVYMQNWEVENEDPYCTQEQDLLDAKAICDQLGIELQVINFAKQYWQLVFEHCLNEFSLGRTPNPDIYCNQHIKFKFFLNYALSLGVDYLATGHYAQIRYHQKEYKLCKGTDPNKDQSYFLYTLGQQQLARCLFPLGNYHKKTVREIAAKAHLATQNKKDSTGICFIGERKFKDFLNEFLLKKPGLIKSDQGEVVGQHDGLMFYTIGQRKGLKIGGIKHSVAGKQTTSDSEQLKTTEKDHEPWFVLSKDIKNNILIVGQGHDHPLLFKSSLLCHQLHWISGKVPVLPLQCSAKTRYRQADQVCELSLVDTHSATPRYRVNFAEKQRAITQGQSVVFYQGDVCLGGAIIED